MNTSSIRRQHILFIDILLLTIFAGVLIFLITPDIKNRVQRPYFIDNEDSVFKLGNHSYEVGFYKKDGGIAYILDKSTGMQVIVGNPDHDLWSIVFRDTPYSVKSSNYSTSGVNRFRYAWSDSDHQLTLYYIPDPSQKKKVSVIVTITPSQNSWLDMQLSIQNQSGSPADTIKFPVDLVFRASDQPEALLPVLPGIVLEPGFFQSSRTYETVYPGYPGVFADFMALNSAKGALGIYTISENQPVVPVTLGFNSTNCVGTGSACYNHAFKTSVLDGQLWVSPRVRLRIGESRSTVVMDFRTDSGISSASLLQNKLAPFYQQIVASPLYKADATQLNIPFSDYPALLKNIPYPGLLHTVAYEPGGFDRNSPDFLPPDPSWGTTADMARMFEEAQWMGFLVMPYINPTWWDGESPTLRNLPQGVSLSKVAVLNEQSAPLEECYGCPDNPHYGYVMSPYTDYVRQRLDQLIKQMKLEVPANLIFEDQIGARLPMPDYNPNSPSPESYIQGWLEHTFKYAGEKLMTGLGFDRLVGDEAGFHGSVLLLERTGMTDGWWGKGNWSYYPFAAMVARDKVLFYQHDLAPETFTHNRAILTWNAAMGYMLSYDLFRSGYGGGIQDEWLRIAGAMQNYVFSQYAAERVMDYVQLSENISRTSFENYTVITNWSVYESYDLDGNVLPPQGMLIKKNNAALMAGIFTSYNGIQLSAGEHYLIEDRQKDKITVRQPSGPDTSITIKLLPDWNAKTKLVAQAFTRDGVAFSATQVEITSAGATFTYQQNIKGSLNVVEYYEVAEVK